MYKGEHIIFVSREGVQGDFGVAILERLPYGEHLLTISEIMHACILHGIDKRHLSLPSDIYKTHARFVIYLLSQGCIKFHKNMLDFDFPLLKGIGKPANI